MNKHIKALLASLMLLALLAGSMTTAFAAECTHPQKVQVTVKQEPVYTSEGASGHRVTVDSMIYWQCTTCKENFSGKPGESTTTTEAHTLVNNKCTKCGYTIPDQLLSKVKNNGTITMNVGDQLQLQPTFATSQGWTVKAFKSSRAKVATVSGTGLVTAVAEGKAKITVTCTNRKKAYITIKVVDPYKATGIKIAQGKKATVSMGSTLQLTAQLTPVTARTTLTWKSSKAKIATVSATGLVTPIKEGKTKITVSTANKKKASITVTVVDPFKPTGITLAQGGTATLLLGQTLTLTPVLAPANAKTTLTWKSSNTRRVTVSNGLVTAVGNGTATVTVTSANGVKATLKVESVDPTVAKRVAIDQTGIQYVNVGETLQLSATVVPATAATALTWKSSRVRYATVDGNGCVTGVARGTCKITVMTANKKKASVTVKVLDPYAPAKVAIAEKGPITLHVGETAQLTPLLTPTTSKTTFTWLTNKARIATVSDTGLVTAVKKGTAKITVRTSNKKKATIVIKVVD